MTLLPGGRIGSYEVIASIGEGPRLVAGNFAFDVTRDGQRFVAAVAGDLDFPAAKR